MFLAIANSISSLIKPYISKITSALAARSDYYENIKGTNNILFDFGVRLLDKASIVLTPTAYSDGSLNTVIPPYQVLPTELVPSIATTVNIGGSITQINGNSYSSTSDGTGVLTIRPKFDFATTNGKLYKLVITPIGTVTGTVNFDFYDGSNYLFNDYDFTTTKEVYFKDNGNVFGAFDGTKAYSVSNFTISIKEVQEADFDFSRGSSATRVNEQGLVEDVQILSGELVQNGNFEQIGAEEVTNGNFETDSDWTKETGWTISDGKANANVTGTQAIYQSGITLNKWYKVTYTISDYVSGDIRLRVGTTSTPTVRSSNGTFTEYLYATGTNQVRISPFTSGFVGSIDNVSVKEVGQNWSFGTGWSMGDGKAVRTGTDSTALSQSFSALQSKKFRLSFEVSDWTVGHLKGYFYGGGGSDEFFDNTSIGNGSFTFEVTTTINRTNFAFLAYGSFDGSVDNVSIKEVTDDTDLPRIDFTGGTGSLLLEPQRTNVIPYSEDFSNSAWTKERATISANTNTSPDGSVNASKIIENTQGGVHSIYEGVAISNNIYTFSCFVKKSDRDYCFLQIVTDLGRYTAVFDLVNGVVTDTQTFSSPTNTSNKIEDYGNGWYRVSVTSSNTSSTTGYFQVGLSDSATPSYSSFKQPTYIGDGSGSIQIWGAQTEVGDYATSYIPTSGSTVTRSADVANNSGNADLFNDSEGVLYAEISALADDSIYRFISISDGTSSNRVFIGYRNTSNSIYILAGTATAFIPHNITDVTKIAIKYKSGDTSVFIDGFEVISKTDTYTLSGLNELAFDSGTGSPFYGNVKCVAVFKEALSNDLLERLTGEGYESFRLLAEANNYTII